MTKAHELQFLIDQRDVLDTELERINAAIRRLEPRPEPGMTFGDLKAQVGGDKAREIMNERHGLKPGHVYEVDPGGGYIPGTGWVKA